MKEYTIFNIARDERLVQGAEGVYEWRGFKYGDDTIVILDSDDVKVIKALFEFSLTDDTIIPKNIGNLVRAGQIFHFIHSTYSWDNIWLVRNEEDADEFGVDYFTEVIKIE